MRVPNSAHDARAWVISQIAPDFKLLDVWALPAEGGADEFGPLLELMASFDPVHSESALTRALFLVRHRLGSLFGWDDATKKRPIPGCTETTLSVRLPGHLRDSATGPVFGEAVRQAGADFAPLYRTDEEWAAEISNETVHGVLHLAWVERGPGRYRGQLAIYVKPRGLLGRAYLLLIEPFRQFIVYPALLHQIGRAWDARRGPRPNTADHA